MEKTDLESSKPLMNERGWPMASHGDVRLRAGGLSGNAWAGARSSLLLVEWSGGGQLWPLWSLIPGRSQESLCCTVGGPGGCQEPGDICCVVTVKYRLITSVSVYFQNSALSLLIPVLVCLALCHCLSTRALARLVFAPSDFSSSLCSSPPPPTPSSVGGN